MSKKDKKHLKELAKRLKEIRFKLNMNQTEFAEKIDFSPGYFSEVEKGKYSPGFMFYYNISTILNVNLRYLFLGEGEIFNITRFEDGKKKTSVVDSESFGDNAEEVKNMLWYIKSSHLVKHSILGYFHELVLKNKEFIKSDIERTKEGFFDFD